MLQRIIQVFPRILLAIIIFPALVSSKASVAPAASWASFLPGKVEGFVNPGLVADPAGGFYLFSSGDRPLIKFNGNGAIAWEAERKSGVNEARLVLGLDLLSGGDVIAIVEADPNAPIFGHQAPSEGRWLVHLSGANGSLISALALQNCWVTSVRANPSGGFFIGGFGFGEGRIGASTIAFGSGAVFLASLADGALQWNVMSAANSQPYLYQITAIRTAGAKLLAAGLGAGPWAFGGKQIASGGVFLIEANLAGAVADARVVQEAASLSALETTAAGEIYVALRKDSGGSIVRRMDGVGWTKEIAGSVGGLAVGSDVFAIGRDGATASWFLSALTKSGQILWRRGEPGRNASSGHHAALLSDGRLAVVGTASQSGIFLDDYFLHDFSALGVAGDGVFLATFPASGAAAPIFRAQPRDEKFAILGERVTLRAEVYSASAVSLQWFKNGNELHGQTQAELILPGARVEDSAIYFLEARNTAGTTRSKTVEVIVNSITVSTVAGTDGQGVLEAPRGPIVLPDGSILVADALRGEIRRVDGGGVTTFSLGEGSKPSAPKALAIERYFGGARFFVIDADNGYWRAGLSPNSQATSVEKSPLNLPGLTALATLEGSETMWLARADSPGISRLAGGSLTPILGEPAFGNVGALAADLRGNVFVADSEMNQIQMVSVGGSSHHVSGHGMTGFQDGLGFVAMFNDISAMTLDESGNLYVTERGNHAVRKISPEGFTTTLAGLGLSGFVNGPGIGAQFSAPEGLCFRNGTLIVADTGNHCLREIRFEKATVPIITDAKIRMVIDAFLRISVEGNPGERFDIVSSSSLNPGVQWKTEGTLILGQLTSELALLKPTATVFYRARKVQ